MTTIKHTKVSAAGAPADASKVGGTDWNADHAISGPHVVAMAKIKPNGFMPASQKFPSDLALLSYGVGLFSISLPGFNLQDSSGDLIVDCSLAVGAGSSNHYVDWYITSATTIDVYVYKESWTKSNDFNYFVLKVWKINP